MITCPHCGFQNLDHEVECIECGTKLPKPRQATATVSLAEERSRNAVNALQAEADARVRAMGLTTPEAVMAHCKSRLARPRPPGRWWAQMILDDHANGVRVHHKALEAAREVIEARATTSDEVE